MKKKTEYEHTRSKLQSVKTIILLKLFRYISFVVNLYADSVLCFEMLKVKPFMKSSIRETILHLANLLAVQCTEQKA